MRTPNTFRNNLRWCGAALIIICGVLTSTTSNCQARGEPTQDEVNRRVHQIVDNNLQAGTVTTSKGVRATPMRADMSLEDLREIGQFGDRAIAPLETYLHSDDYRAQRLVVNVLGAIGGAKVVNPLSYAAEHSPSAIVRYAAVANLGQQPWQMTAAVIKRVAVSDSDSDVRKKAGEIIAREQPSSRK